MTSRSRSSVTSGLSHVEDELVEVNDRLEGVEGELVEVKTDLRDFKVETRTHLAAVLHRLQR